MEITMTDSFLNSVRCRTLATGMWIMCALWWYIAVGGAWLDLRGAEPLWALVALPLTWITVRWFEAAGRPLSTGTFLSGLLAWVGSFGLWYIFMRSGLGRRAFTLGWAALLWGPGYATPLLISLWMAARSAGFIGPTSSTPRSR